MQKALISKYKIEGYEVWSYRILTDGSMHTMTVRSIGNGITSRVKDVTELMALEEVVKQSCEKLKTLLDVMVTLVVKKSSNFKLLNKKREIL